MKHVLILIIASLLFSQEGKIVGKVFDKTTGEELIGANVFLEGTSFGAASDIDGSYSIKAPAGTYTLLVDYVSYNSLKIKNVVIQAGKNTQVNLEMAEDVLTSDVVIVEAKLYDNNVNGLLVKQKNSSKVFDAVSSEQMSKSSDGNAGAALKRVTGVTLVGGKNVFVRGLGNRYSDVQVNGSTMPSTNPNKKEVPVDLFSTSLLDNIIVQKSYSVDLPGEFAGGSVLIKTKDFPDERKMELAYSTSYNTISTFKDYLGYDGGSYDFLGFDDGSRSLPDEILNGGKIDALLSTEADKKTYSEFNSEWTPKTFSSIPSQSISFLYADEFELNEKSLGFISSLSYNNSVSVRPNRISRYINQGSTAKYDAKITSAKKETSLNAMLNVFYKFSNDFQLGIKNMFVNSSEDQSAEIAGEQLEQNLLYQQNQLLFTQKTVFNTNLNSKAFFRNFFDSKLTTDFSYSYGRNYEPDSRRALRTRASASTDENYRIDVSKDFGTSHFYTKNSDNNYDVKAKLESKIQKTLKMSFGFSSTFKHRNVDIRRFDYKSGSSFSLSDETVEGSYENALIADNIRFDGFKFIEKTGKYDNHSAKQSLVAGFINSSIDISKKLNLVAGLRFENSSQKVITESLEGDVNYDESSFLPAMNWTYRFSDKINLRLGGSRTLSRPQFRELAPIAYRDFFGGVTRNGNPNLVQSAITNLDFRTEYYPKAGEILSLGLYYKSFDKPIEERFRRGENDETEFINAKSASLLGFELEFKKNLYENLFVNANLSLSSSSVLYPDELKKDIANSERPLQGQSPYVVNLNLFYTFENGLDASLAYNRFGERINRVGTREQGDDEKETPFDKLDLILSYKYSSYKFKFTVKNLLNDLVEFQQNGVITNKYEVGRTISTSVSIEL